MFTRNVSFHLKSNMLADYTRTFDKDILPLLRRQNGFKDEITFSGPGGIDVTAIILWDNKHYENAGMRFDYRMRPGVLTRTNGLNVMAALGLLSLPKASTTDATTPNPTSTFD